MSLTNGAAHGSRVAGRRLYVASAGLMSRMRVESQGCGFRCRGWKIILREIQVRVRGK